MATKPPTSHVEWLLPFTIAILKVFSQGLAIVTQPRHLGQRLWPPPPLQSVRRIP